MSRIQKTTLSEKCMINRSMWYKSSVRKIWSPQRLWRLQNNRICWSLAQWQV